MNEFVLPKIVKAKPGTDLALKVTFKNEGERTVNLEGFIARYGALAPLRDRKIFAKVKVIDWGAGVGWPGELDIAAATLLRMSDEQRPFANAEFRAWQSDANLTNQETASVLGVSLATVKNYRTDAAIPPAVAIACRTMMVDPAVLAAHLYPRKPDKAA